MIKVDYLHDRMMQNNFVDKKKRNTFSVRTLHKMLRWFA